MLLLTIHSLCTRQDNSQVGMWMNRKVGHHCVKYENDETNKHKKPQSDDSVNLAMFYTISLQRFLLHVASSIMFLTLSNSVPGLWLKDIHLFKKNGLHNHTSVFAYFSGLTIIILKW